MSLSVRADSLAGFEPPPNPTIIPTTAPPIADSDTLAEIVVHATEPRFVAPTRRDQIGRIWAPVYINGNGPFRLVLDTGANHSGITAEVALSVGLALDSSLPVLLRGVTGAASVPTVAIDSLRVGDLQEGAERLPIITDALGGAQGVLGTDEMRDRRIDIDFRHDHISIARSKGERAPPDYRVIPFETMRGNLLAVESMVGGVRTKAIIDTGGQVTIANMALRRALIRQRSPGLLMPIEGVTKAIQEANTYATPPLRMFGIDKVNSFVEFQYHDVSYADMSIFEHWQLTDEPAMLIGMDALGLLDTLVIDYRRHELFMRTRSGE
jgi:hypothetical protein